jgi:hypothetical protein
MLTSKIKTKQYIKVRITNPNNKQLDRWYIIEFTHAIDK